MSDQAAHIANIILFVIVGGGFGIALISVISVIVRVRRGKLKFVPADPRSIDPFEHTGKFDKDWKSNPAYNLRSGNHFNSSFSSFDDH